MKESDKNKKEMAVLEDSQQQIAFEVEDYLKKNYLLRYNMMTRIFKEYNLNFNDRSIHSHNVMFSSYPGAMTDGIPVLSMTLLASKSPPTHVAAVLNPPPIPPIERRSAVEPRTRPAFFSKAEGLYSFSASAFMCLSTGELPTSFEI